MFTQSKDPNNKNKPAYKNIVLTVTKQITLYLLASKNNEMMKTNEILILAQNLHKNLLYSTFALLLMIEQNVMILDTDVEVLHATLLTTKTFHKTDTVLHLEIDLVMIKILLLHNTLDHDMILTNAIHDLTAPHKDLHTDLLTEITLARDIDHALIQENTTFQKTQFLTDHLPDQEILDLLDHAHIPFLETNSTWYNHKTPLNQ